MNIRRRSLTRPARPPPSPLEAALAAIASHKWAGAAAAALVVVAAAAVVATGRAEGLVAAAQKSGFPAAFSLVFVSELGDKTFFISALLAMRYGRAASYIGSMAALFAMSLISVAIGHFCRSLPASFTSTVPIGEYAAVAMMAAFGVRTLKEAYDMPDKPAGAQGTGTAAHAEASEAVAGVTVPHHDSWAAILETFTLVFAAEWGDRSMLATVAIAATASPLGVIGGATAANAIAMTIAVVGGAFLSHRISEKTVGYVGGALFLLFAVLGLTGTF